MSPFVSDPAERALSAPEYLAGALLLAVIAGALTFTAVIVRRALLPGWSGPPAVLANIVAGLTAAIVLGETLGTFGAFGDFEYAIGCVLLSAASVFTTGRLRRIEPTAPPAPAASRVGLLVAGGVCAVILAGWLIPTISGLTGGMGRADSLWYHMPLSAKFVQTGSTGDLFFFDPIFLATFYPANTELLHAIPILAFARDFISPMANVGFLGLGLLAGWCIGRPYGVAPQALLGASVVLGAETMVDFQAGEALNDVGGVAFVLCAVALLANARPQPHPPPSGPLLSETPSNGPLDRWAVGFAGAAAGLAAGTKLSFLAPVALLTVAVVLLAPRRARLRLALVWTAPMLLAGGYWYLRNLVAVGNPIPYTAFGPLGLPAPERDFELRPGFAIAHYITNLDIWGDWFAPFFAEELGPLWALILIAVVAGGLYALWRVKSDPLLRALGAVALLTAIAYVFTPLTAGGEEGEPIAFEWNIRYLAPALGIGLAILPCLPVLRSTARRRALMLAAMAILSLVTTLSIAQWGPEYANKTSAIAISLAVFGVFVALLFARSRGWVGPAASPRRSLALAAIVLAGAVGAGQFVQNYHLERRYENLSPQLNIAEAVRWARDLRDARIAVSAVRGVFNQYAFYGTALRNEVQWLGQRGGDGAFTRIPDCQTWRAAINDGDFDYVVTMYDPYLPGGLADTKEALWTRGDNHAREIVRDGPVSVFAITAPLDPAGCGDLPDLETSELSGDSVNNDPLANQPPFDSAADPGEVELPPGHPPIEPPAESLGSS